MTLNGVMAVILRYFSEFGYLPGVLRNSSRSLSHLLMSSCFDNVAGKALNRALKTQEKHWAAEARCPSPIMPPHFHTSDATEH